MNRFHVHLAVEDLDRNIAFYTALLGQAPAVVKTDYAKWMLDDPRINLAISARGAQPGLDHLGIQVEQAADLAMLKEHYEAADAASVVSEPGTVCCYAKSDKHWVTDPQGIAWEAYHTLDSAPTFNDESAGSANACCTPSSQSARHGKVVDIPVTSVSSKCC